MSTTYTATQERTVSLANQLATAIGRSFTLGVDNAGYTHHYYRSADAVVVFNGRELNHYQPLAGRTLNSWKQFISEERGWSSFGQLAPIGLNVDSERKESHA